MSDIFVKTTTTTGWKKASNIFVKTTTATGWKAAIGVWIKTATQWLKVWPLSGVFATRTPWVGPNSDTAYSDRLTSSSVIRVGSNYYGNNGIWDANGWTITGYSYAWKYYQGAENYWSPEGTIDSGTGSGWTISSGQDVLPISIWTATNSSILDEKYLSFNVIANTSNSTYKGDSDSTRIKVVRRIPINISRTLSSFAPQVGDSISYSSSWDLTEARKPDATRTSIEWYKNLSNSTTGGTFLSSGSYSYTVQSSDLNYYIYAVETTFNSGTDYDLGLNTGVSVSRITTSVVSPGLTAPTSTSIVSVSRLNDTQTRVVVSSSGGSGPNYQLFWTGAASAPTSENRYDAASPTSTVTEDYEFSNGVTYYFYIRSSDEYLGPTTENGTGTAGTFSAYGPTTGAAFYTFAQPSGTVSVSPSSGTAGTTTFTATPSVSASPSAQVSYQWQYYEGGSFGWLAISGATSSTYAPPSNYVSVYGTNLRCQITANNGVGTQLVTTTNVTVAEELTKLPTPTGLSATTNRTDGIYMSWDAVPGAAYYGVWYRGGAPSYDSAPDFGGPNNPTLITSSNYLDTSIGAGVTRSYDVQAFRSGNPTGTKSEYGGPVTGTRLAPPSAPSGGSVSVSPSSGTAGSTTFTAIPSGWSGNPSTFTYSYSWQRFTNGVYSYQELGTGSTFSPTVSQNSTALAWQVVLTVSNGVSPNGTASTSFTVNAPVSNLTAPSIYNVIKSGSSYLVYFTGGSGPYYQVWWQGSSGTPTTTGYDFSGSSSPISVTNLTASAGSTYYFSARSVSSPGNTGSGPSSTISSWSGQYAYTAPSAAPATAPGTPGTPTNGWTGGTAYPFSWSAPSAGTVSGGGAASISYYNLYVYQATNSSGSGSTLVNTYTVYGTSFNYT